MLFGCAIAGDPIAGWMVRLPCALFAVFELAGPARRQGTAAAGWLAASLCVSGALLSLAASTGGFVDVQSPAVFAPPDQIAPNLVQFFRWWVALGGGNVEGLPAAPQAVLALGRGPVCLIVLACVALEIGASIRRGRRGRWLDDVLAVAVLASVAEMAISAQGSQSRYVVPA